MPLSWIINTSARFTNFHFALDDGFMDNTIAYYREEDGPNWPNPP